MYVFTCVFFFSDIDECFDGAHNCSVICTNTEGSFICDCNIGYLLDTDEITCHGMQKSFVHTYAQCYTCTLLLLYS